MDNDIVSALPEKKPRKLTLKQERFCKLYAKDARFFGNGTQAYIEAYKVDLSMPGAYQVAAQSAAENLKKPYLVDYINSLLDDLGFTDIAVDKQLAFLINQHGNYQAKIAAIKEYNALKKRITQKIELNDHRETRAKIKDFLDGPTSTDDKPDAPSSEPPAQDAGTGDHEMASTSTDIS
jgi:hypothetical protein